MHKHCSPQGLLKRLLDTSPGQLSRPEAIGTTENSDTSFSSTPLACPWHAGPFNVHPQRANRASNTGVDTRYSSPATLLEVAVGKAFLLGSMCATGNDKRWTTHAFQDSHWLQHHLE